MPSRITAVKARKARPQTLPSVRARSTDACSSPLTLAAWRRIQNSIHVTTAGGDQHRDAFEDLLVRLLQPADRREQADPTARLSTIAAPAPIQIWPAYRPFPVFTR